MTDSKPAPPAVECDILGNGDTSKQYLSITAEVLVTTAWYDPIEKKQRTAKRVLTAEQLSDGWIVSVCCPHLPNRSCPKCEVCPGTCNRAVYKP